MKVNKRSTGELERMRESLRKKHPQSKLFKHVSDELRFRTIKKKRRDVYEKI
jgi:hypothetical protein